VSVGEWFIVVSTVGAFVTGTYYSISGLLSTARTERRSEAQRHQQEIAAARVEERAICEQQLNGLLRERDDLVRERDAERGRADALQNLINQWRLRGDS